MTKGPTEHSLPQGLKMVETGTLGNKTVIKQNPGFDTDPDQDTGTQTIKQTK